MKIAVVGATGQVGGVMRALLAERRFPVDEVRYFASSRSAGSTLDWNGTAVTVDVVTAAGVVVALVVVFLFPDLALWLPRYIGW